jgi:LemA protein
MTQYILVGSLLLIVFYVIVLYNNIIKNKNSTDNAFGSIDAMLKKRYDLIPNLVETVKQYMFHEASVLTEVTKLRSGLTDNLSSDDKVELHNNISKKLNNILVSVENYPDLKASQNFMKLQSAWNETEEQISAARRYFNAAVTEYNNSIQIFPARLIANIYGFCPKKVFEIDEPESKNVNAKDLFKQ